MRKLITMFQRLSKKNKIEMAFAIGLTILLIVSVPVMAWFVNSRKIASMIKINAPTSLTIGAGAGEAAEMINLANIDVEETIGSTRVLEGRYVIGITGRYLSMYDLQIARTTNIPFEYQLYRVSSVEMNDEDDLEKGWGTTDEATMEALKSAGYLIATYEDSNAVKHYYPFLTQTYNNGDSNYLKAGHIVGNYLNPKYEIDSPALIPLPIGKGEDTLGTGTYHSHNYGTYNNTNKYAEPLYWQAEEIPINTSGRMDGGYFVDYYVLVISWNANFTDTKETDMIYITAQRH